jgi:hypothetical protein
MAPAGGQAQQVKGKSETNPIAVISVDRRDYFCYVIDLSNQYSMRNDTRSNNVTFSASWKSPVPYLFAGMAGMVFLIAVAFLILVCSYWKLCADSEELTNTAASAEGGGENHDIEYIVDTEENVMVIMPGDEKPTFIGKPISHDNPGDTVPGE